MARYCEARTLIYGPNQIYDLVADVKEYHKFLPWCISSNVRKMDNEIIADLVIGYSVFFESYTSSLTLKPYREISTVSISSTSGSPLKHLESQWLFYPSPVGCHVQFCVDFTMRSPLIQGVIERAFEHIFIRIIRAFEKRATLLYPNLNTKERESGYFLTSRLPRRE